MTRTTVPALVAALLVGCSGQAPPPAPRAEAPKHEEHAHQSQHGGIVVPVGREDYHAEAVFEKGGTLRLYLLGADEAKIQETEAKPLDAYARAVGNTEAEKFVLKPEPQPGDAPGKTSQFVGQLPGPLAGKNVEVTVPNVAIGGGRFRIGFQSVPPQTAHAEPGMPAKLGTEEERKLFLTPGGKYTRADIEANGNTVPSVKFRGVHATHDAKPAPGTPICPISETKSNPKFTWIVGGKTYEFCCTPCIEEFVATAKEKPDAVKGPEFYHQK
ncbi:MAG TPA: hypothetical protein VFG68_05065 [Fimbriiglobus sp.]|nr:hypothetical protein [Fimbriiglobus sp.]